MQQTQEVSMISRNPIAKSFGAGINQPQVIPNRKRKGDRRVMHRRRDLEYDDI